jgi:hypothetical protein
MKTTAEQIDLMAAAYEKKAAEAERVTSELGNMRKELVGLVEREGLAASGEKSKLLSGGEWEIVATFGHSTKLDEASVLKLQAAMQKADRLSEFKKIFSRDIRYSMKRGAQEAAALLPAPFRKLYEAAVRTVSRTPSLDVRKKKLAQLADSRSEKASA